jgi:hypothetical protein
MNIYKLSDMVNGWFIGNFEPSVIKTTEFEVGCHFYKKGTKTINHIHKFSIEINLIVTGKIQINEIVLEAGSIFIFGKGEESGLPEFLDDTILSIIKIPSCLNDKTIVN